MQMPHFARPYCLTLVRALAWLGAGAVLGLAPLSAQPVSPAAPAEEVRMSAEAALKILLGDAAPALARPAVAPAAAPAQAFPVPPAAEALPGTSALKVVVRPGDTVDSLLRRHLRDSAFSTAFQRQALVRLNPSVFQKGQVHRLEVGTTLWMPTDTILMGLLPGAGQPRPVQAIPSSAADSAGQDASGTARQPVHSPSPSRGWVRYP